MSDPEQHRSRLHVTPAARQAVLALRAARGEAVMFVQSAGCCAGSVPMCFPDGEFAVGEHDTLVGTVVGCRFFIDDRLDAAWNHPDVELDVAPGQPEGFSLAAGPGQRFISRPVSSIPHQDDLALGTAGFDMGERLRGLLEPVDPVDDGT